MDTKTLYVSDLDGTLLRNDESISAFTVCTLNRLMARGLSFTYATARSVESARTVTGGLRLPLPVITRNGTVLADGRTGRHLFRAVFSPEEVALLESLLPELPRFGFVSCYPDENMIKTFVPGPHTPGMEKYLAKNRNDPRLVPAAGLPDMFRSEVGYVTLIDDREKIRPVWERVRTYPGWETVFQKDTYWDEYWLEICPRNCTKAKAALRLKEELGFEKLVVFGDSVNDMPLFRAADESYAVSNALDGLKSIATAVIGSNGEDAVARFLLDRA